MNTFCMRCSSPIDPFDIFCPFCGSEAPRRTIPPNIQPHEVSDGIYCLACGHYNIKEALFCISCGKSRYKKPAEPEMYCAQCGTKNKNDALYCFSCRFAFDTWFEMKGAIARELGYNNSFILHETMTDIHYHFIKKEKISIGRSPGNDIIIPSSWVTKEHSIIDTKNWKLIDKKSLNGTYINRSSERISSISLSKVNEYNIAGIFTFNVVRKEHIFVFRLTAVLDEDEVKESGQLDEINELRKHYFILIAGDGEIDIRKMDGEILSADDDKMEYFTTKIIEDNYYFYDPVRDIDNRLLLKKYNNLPLNWEFNFLDQNTEY